MEEEEKLILTEAMISSVSLYVSSFKIPALKNQRVWFSNVDM